MKRSIVAIAVFAACACSSSMPLTTTSPSAATASRITYPATPTATATGRFAVIQTGDTRIALVDVNRVYAVGTVDFVPASFRPNAVMPFTSASSTRLYYLTNGPEVGFLTPGGNQGIVGPIPLFPYEEVGFAVSPDDQRIAVSVFTYSSADPDAKYEGMRMYVEDLVGGGHHVDIFTSPTVAEFPIGWVGGNLVVAVSQPFCCAAPLANPYGADSYHIVDPATGRRLRSICSTTAPPQGPVEPIGVLCGLQTFQHWDGTPFSPPAVVPDPGADRVALSPDGSAVLYGGSPVQVIRGVNEFALDESGVACGWVDARHVVVATPNNIYWLLDARTGVGAEVPGGTGYLGAFPAAIS